MRIKIIEIDNMNNEMYLKMKFNGMDEIMDKNANRPCLSICLSICVRLIYVAPPSINSLLSNYIPFDIRYLPPFYRTWSFIRR
jgi:hypothetical protein